MLAGSGLGRAFAKEGSCAPSMLYSCPASSCFSRCLLRAGTCSRPSFTLQGLNVAGVIIVL